MKKTYENENGARLEAMPLDAENIYEAADWVASHGAGARFVTAGQGASDQTFLVRRTVRNASVFQLMPGAILAEHWNAVEPLTAEGENA